MALLQEIQEAAVDDKVPISTLLRKCAVLAARLDNAEMQAWVSRELNGYDSIDDVPDYRVIGAAAIGSLAGPFGSGYNNITIPPMVLPEKMRRLATEVRFTQPIAELAAMAEGGGYITCPWPGDLLAYMQSKEGNKFENGLVLYDARQNVSKAAIHGIIDTVRNRVLEFALKLEKEAPAAGEPDKTGSKVSDAVVSHLYQTIIHGDVIGNVATGNQNTQTVGDINIAKGDIGALTAKLREWGIPQPDINELQAAITEELPKEGTTLADKPKVKNWLMKTWEKTLTGGLTLTQGVSIDLVAQLIGQCLGIPGIPSF